MAEKLQSYQGFLGRLHSWRENAREWRENRSDVDAKTYIKNLFTPARENTQQSPNQDADISDYSHIYRKKTGAELVRVSATVMGIEFAYAAETAFVSPTLLKIGVQHEHMTLVWALSPLIGFFMTPLLGSLSDRCRLNWGRRRPFIVLLAVGVFLGLLLVPNGESLGYAMGDSYQPISIPQWSAGSAYLRTSPTHPRLLRINATFAPPLDSSNTPTGDEFSRPWGVFFTILGTALLDFDADACQSPARAYLLDVTVPDDHARGLSTFTIMAGLGGFMGYALGGINWDDTALGIILGGHVRAVFTLITFIFVICVSYTITSFKEIPLNILEKIEKEMPNDLSAIRGEVDQSYGTVVACSGGTSQVGEMLKDFPPSDMLNAPEKCYVNLGYEEKDLPKNGIVETSFVTPANVIQLSRGTSESGVAYQGTDGAEMTQDEGDPVATLGQYLLSIVYMPNSLRILCLTNLFCWMAHVCYSLYFTDFVGEAVFKGDPKAPDGSESKKLYEEGVRFGCWGMSFYSLSCACYSTVIERLITRFRARKVYVGGLLVYSAGMMLMAFSQNRFGVILFSWTAGIMYSTLFTMPYLLIAHYHSSDTFKSSPSGGEAGGTQLRGLGTDVAILSSMVFLAQFILSMFMGSIVSAVGSTAAVIAIASFLAFCGAIAAYHVMYLEL